MYSMIEVIYGVPLSDSVREVLEKLDAEPEEYDFETLYSGSAKNTPGYLGVQLTGFDECEEYQRLDLQNKTIYCGENSIKAYNLTPSDEQKTEVQAMIDKLPDNIKEVLQPIGVYFIWSTS